MDNAEVLTALSNLSVQVSDLSAQIAELAFYLRVSLIMQGALVGFLASYIVFRFCRVRELI